jgi:hypothetical protein
MSTAKKILDRLSGVRETKNGWEACCPAHEDRRPSLGISEGSDGRVLLHCRAGCSTKAIVDALGLAERDLFDADSSRPTTPKAAATKVSTPKAEKKAGKAYVSADAAQKAYCRYLGKPAKAYEYEVDGELVGAVIRWDQPRGAKEIRPISRHADGWRLEQMPEPRPLFKLAAFSAPGGGRVHVVEGEKCVEALVGLGLLATTSAGGSSSARHTDWTPLAGRDVVILPDADTPGRKYAAEVAEILLALDPPAIVRIVDLAPDADDGSDVADLVEPARCLGEPLRELIERRVDETEPLAARSTVIARSSARPKIEEYEPLPVDALPDAAAELVVDAAKAIGCDEAFVAMPLLAVLGSAIGTTRRIELKADWRPLPIVWPVIVAESGSKKSPGADVTLDLVRDREATLNDEHADEMLEHETELELYERSRAAWRSQKPKDRQADDDDPPRRPPPPVARRVMVEDTTTEALAVAMAENPRGLILAADELNSWLANMDRYAGKGGGDEAFFLKSYSGRSHNVLRRGGRRLHVRQAALWITGTIQPGVLRRSLSVERKESGLAARMLLASPPRRPAKWSEATVSPIVRDCFGEIVRRLYELKPHVDEHGHESSLVVPLDYEAKKLWVDFYDQHNDEAASLVGDLLAAWSKLEETAGRLALILHETKAAAGQARPDLVDADTMRRALRLTAWFKRETRRVYALLAESDLDQAIRQADDRLAAWIVRRGGTVTPRDVLTGCRWIETADDAEAALAQLVAAGRGRWEDRPPGEKGGRPTRHFVLYRQGAESTREASIGQAASAQLLPARPKGSFADADAADGPQTKGGVIEL